MKKLCQWLRPLLLSLILLSLLPGSALARAASACPQGKAAARGGKARNE